MNNPDDTAFCPNRHHENLLNSIERYRKEIPTYFHSGEGINALQAQYPGIQYGHLLSTIKVLEEDEEKAFFRSAVFEADRLMAEYQGGYSINSDKGYCEMKYIYFPGIAYAKTLRKEAERAKVERKDRGETGNRNRELGLEFASKLILIAMIGYLTNLLKDFNIDKSHLRSSLVRRVINDSFDRDLGDFGCYLIYKCVSTTPDHTSTEVA